MVLRGFTVSGTTIFATADALAEAFGADFAGSRFAGGGADLDGRACVRELVFFTGSLLEAPFLAADVLGDFLSAFVVDFAVRAAGGAAFTLASFPTARLLMFGLPMLGLSETF